MAKDEQERARNRREVEKANKQAEESRKKARQAERRANAIEAQSNLERIARGCGVVDTDYAIHLYKRHCIGKTEEELGKMDEDAFFKGLRQPHPHLFGEVFVPATTGTSGAPRTPTPGVTATAAANAGKVDVRTMTKAQYEEYKRKQGLVNVPTGLG